MQEVYVMPQRLFVSKPREDEFVTFSINYDIDRSDHFVTREDAPTRRQGRKISRRQWKRQNAKMIRRHRKVMAYLKLVSKRVSDKLEADMIQSLYTHGTAVKFGDTVLTEEKMREMFGLPPKPTPKFKWEFAPQFPMRTGSYLWNSDIVS